MLVQLTCPSRYLDSFGELGLFDTRLLGASARDAVHVYRINFLFFFSLLVSCSNNWHLATVEGTYRTPSAQCPHCGSHPFFKPGMGPFKKDDRFPASARITVYPVRHHEALTTAVCGRMTMQGTMPCTAMHKD